MGRFRLVLAALALAPIHVGQASAATATPVIETAADGIFVTDAGGHRQLTKSGKDEDPVLSPDGKTVVFTRQGPTKADSPTCEGATDELRVVGIDGRGEKLLLKSREGGKPEEHLCSFGQKQFSSDGRRLYFTSPAWATSDAVHQIDLVTLKQSYMLPANDLLVLNFCEGEHTDQLLVQQHRYLVQGGSYDWYWLFKRDGKTEVGPAGDIDEGTNLEDWAMEYLCPE